MTIHPAAHPRSIPATPASDDKATTRLRLNYYHKFKRKRRDKISKEREGK